MFTKWLEKRKVKKAVKTLTKALVKDEDLWLAYKANIAVCFQDEIRKVNPYTTIGKANIHAVSNHAAQAFLTLWTRDVKK